MILTCHYLLFSGANSGLGRYLGGTGTMIFFLISALLYGNKYNSDNYLVANEPQFEFVKFVKRRIIKIGSSLYPFLFLLCLLFVVFGVNFSWIDVGLNFAFLGYFGKLPGNGHLWFITVLMACYLEMAVLIKIRPNKSSFAWTFLATMVFLMFLGERLHVPGGAFIHLGFFGFMFLKSHWFYKKTQEIVWWQSLAIIVFNAACILFELNGLFEQSRAWHFLLTDICGLSLLALLLRYLPKQHNNWVAFLSSISLEIYLIHHTLCAGPIIRVTSWSYCHIINFAAMVIISVLFAFILHYVAQLLSKMMAKVL